MKEIKNIKASEVEERIAFFHNEYHRLRAESVLENNPITKHSIEKNMQEALSQKESAENLLKNISKEEVRHEQYLRILTFGVSGEADYEAVKYLKDKGYTDSPVQISSGRDSYGKVINVIWQGATSHGFDYIDELRTRTNHNDIKLNKDYKSNNTSNEAIKKLPNERPKSSWIIIAEGVCILVLAGIIFFLFHEHLGISLK